MDIYTASDHNAILWKISRDQKRERPNRQTNTTVGWKVKTFYPSTLIVAIDSIPIVARPAEEMTKDLMKRDTHACDASMLRKHNMNQRPARSYRRPNSAELITEYKKARRSFYKAIKDSTRRYWEELINEVDKNPWGRPYKRREFSAEVETATTGPASKRKKTTGRTVIIRPLCMLNTADKIFERIIQQRIEAAVEPLLADNLYGFRKGRSTLDAINLVVNTAREAISGTRWKCGTKKYCLVATLDIRNAFNCANWECIMQALREKTHRNICQVEHASAKASVMSTSLARLVPNVVGLKQSRRRLLSSVVTSILTYGISIWADALEIQEAWRKAGPVYRLSALRVASAFRTISQEAVCVISGTGCHSGGCCRDMAVFERISTALSVMIHRNARPAQE
ncbi:hypothetical protein EVAR_60291_1 [Eumeta japonica]|uniref:Reverse transcriptase domain-containing protein n=1 Tax=Eumeta variegata TaxID=151549 RepID=A0A4C1Z0C0_EUMVA|nr:hypothetical protein EVAR_60291_1 [Eumeta japonica]